MKKKCYEDKDNKLILDNIENFNNYHKKFNTDNLLIDNNFEIFIPITINICLTNSKYSVDFIKYSKYIVDVLNEGYSGNIKNKYKSPEYSEEFFSIISNNIEHGKIIHNYINYKFDSKIRFYLDSIVYYNKNFEIEFTDVDTELLIDNFYKQGFNIKNEHKLNLNINIVKFTCMTLGVSTFPWNQIILNKTDYPMFVFIDYKTIHPDLSTCKFNNSRTIIHEVGHIFGLKHIFKNNSNALDCYKIMLGNSFYNDIFTNPNYKENTILSESNIFQLYPDVIGQHEPTIKNPIEKKQFILNNNIPINFACFMDYSPDEVLTHFTLSQCKIMRTIIYIYKNYLIKNSEKHKNKFNKTKLYLPEGYIINFKDKKFSISSTPFIDKEFIYQISFKENLSYSIKNNPKIVDK
jgi:hypothetical protein